ncbi:MAG: hypothetical protein AB1546_05640 [bacterium]
MKWNDLIEQIMLKNQGIASINFLYEQAKNYKELPSGDWQKTLRGVLYREVNRRRFKKIGLGVYALSSYEENKDSAYLLALKNNSSDGYLKDVKDYHSVIEGMLIEIGNFFEYRTYTSDVNKNFDGKRLKDLCGITEIPNFTYSELKNLISKSDVIWFNKLRLPFPKFIFEVESTTDFTKSMFKMYQLLDFDIRFVLVAKENKKNIFLDRMDKEPFAVIKDKFNFRSFEEVAKLYFNSVEHYDLKYKFLPQAGGHV